MKLMLIFGTRPEVIKLAPVVFEAQRQPDIDLLICSSGQHRQMLDQALAVFSIKPQMELLCMQDNQTLAGLTARLINRVTHVLLEHRPDIVLVQGDTTTAFASALAAFYLRIPVAHVEAGLRTGISDNPFPEEFNRVAISRVANWNFAPTSHSADCLRKEAVDASKVFVSGNTIVDSIQWIKQRWSNPNLQYKPIFKFTNTRLVLVTSHRRENLGNRLIQICEAIKSLSIIHPEVDFIFPVHLNPEVKKIVYRELESLPNLYLIEPVDFEASLYLQSRCSLIITDSGGIQEEAASFGVPTIVLRDHTERKEGITTGYSELVGTNKDNIIEAANRYLSQPSLHEQLLKLANPYGDGQASKRIIETLIGKSVKAFNG